jgi:aryl-alcohol dehydrogenase-like predicted oxidoreductase
MNDMKYRHFNQAAATPRNISCIGFGAMGISEFYGPSEESLAREAIQAAVTQGINHFDTADGYGYGDNERFLGSVLNLSDTKKRQSVIVASKAGILRDRQDPSVRGISIEPSYLEGKLRESLANLGTDYLDIFYIHRLPPNATIGQLQTLAQFLKEVLESGRALSIGLSEPRLDQLSLIHSLCPVHYVQSEYSMIERGVEHSGMLEFCRSNAISFVAYSPLCRGLLTDSFDATKLASGDFRTTLPRFSGENLEHNLRMIADLKAIAASLNTSLAALSVSWLLHQNVLVIPGMRRPERVTDAMKALDLPLGAEKLTEIGEVLQREVKGTRYAPAAMQAYGFE